MLDFGFWRPPFGVIGFGGGDMDGFKGFEGDDDRL